MTYSQNWYVIVLSTRFVYSFFLQLRSSQLPVFENCLPYVDLCKGFGLVAQHFLTPGRLRDLIVAQFPPYASVDDWLGPVPWPRTVSEYSRCYPRATGLDTYGSLISIPLPTQTPPAGV